MMRREVRALIVVLCFVAAVLGTLWGREAAKPVSETDVINRYANDYVAQGGEGAALTDCLATPSAAEGVWMIVRCTPSAVGQRPRVYVVGPDGELVTPSSEDGPRT